MRYALPKIFAKLAIIATVIVCASQNGNCGVMQWPAASGGNNHYYELVISGQTVSWEEAQQAASSSLFQGIQGHLLTVNSAAEHRFVEFNWSSQFTNTGSQNATWAWIGLTDRNVEGDYEWVTGEAFTFTAWHHLEPNNLVDGEDFVHYWLAVDDNSFSWNDSTSPAANANNGLELAYFVEYEVLPVPEPNSAMAFALVFALGTIIRWRPQHADSTRTAI